MRDTTGMPRASRPRPTARLIVLDDLDRLLLFQFEDADIVDPHGARPALFWATPGGGVEPGETYEEAAWRELWEETGLAVDALGPCLYEDEKLLVCGGEAVLFQQRYYLVRVAAAEISLAGFNALERAVYRDHRWWTVAELRASAEYIVPDGLPAIIGRAIAHAPKDSRNAARDEA